MNVGMNELTRGICRFLKDVQHPSQDTFRYQNAAAQRATLFPNLNYSGLYYALNNLIDVFHVVTSGQIGSSSLSSLPPFVLINKKPLSALGHALLATLKCLYLFLERELIDQLPYNISCLLCVFPKELHQDLMYLLCEVLLPFTLLGTSSLLL